MSNALRLREEYLLRADNITIHFGEYVDAGGVMTSDEVKTITDLYSRVKNYSLSMPIPLVVDDSVVTLTFRDAYGNTLIREVPFDGPGWWR